MGKGRKGGHVRAAVVLDEDDVLVAGNEVSVEIAKLAALACTRLRQHQQKGLDSRGREGRV